MRVSEPFQKTIRAVQGEVDFRVVEAIKVVKKIPQAGFD